MPVHSTAVAFFKNPVPKQALTVRHTDKHQVKKTTHWCILLWYLHQWKDTSSDVFWTEPTERRNCRVVGPKN